MKQGLEDFLLCIRGNAFTIPIGTATESCSKTRSFASEVLDCKEAVQIGRKEKAPPSHKEPKDRH